MGSQGSLGPLFLCIYSPIESPVLPAQQLLWISVCPACSCANPAPQQNHALQRGELFPHTSGHRCFPALTAGTWGQTNRTISMAHLCLVVSLPCPRSSSRVPQLEARGGSPCVSCTAEAAGFRRKEGTLTTEPLQQQHDPASMNKGSVG